MNLEISIMKTNIFFTSLKRQGPTAVLAAAFLFMFWGGCELIDPTEVKNPQITEENFLGQPATAAASLSSARFGFADLLDNTAYFTDVVSDNYDNVATFISPSADNPSAVRSDDLTLNGAALYSIAQRERAQITYFLTTVVPKDPNATATVVGDLKFYRGMATLILAENFAYAPSIAGGAALSSSQLVDLAIADFVDATTTASTSGSALFPALTQAAQFALARAYYDKGDKANASAAATAALAISGTYLFSSPYDPATQVNTFFTFAVARALKDMQPLPRLDFLDPKYTIDASPIAALKAEEMHLILAEVALSNNDLPGARTSMKNAITVALGTSGGRTTSTFVDADTRSGTGWSRPNGDTLLIRADASSPALAGLLKRRSSSTVSQKAFSNTSVTTANVDTLVAAADHLWMLHLLRQQIFFGEGRRMSDLGIRLPIIQREIETSPTVSPGDPGTTSTVPAYIPAGSGLDSYTLAAGVVTITTDMNKVLATNRVARFSMPF
jgi:hypothetical protein